MISLKKTKPIIRIRKSGKDRQNNCQEKKDKRTKTILQNTTQKTKDRATRTLLKTEGEPKTDVRLIRVLHLFSLPK